VTPRARRNRRRPGAPGSWDRRTLLWATLIALLTFLIGYGITALAFTSGSAPADVVMVPDVRELQIEQANRVMSRAGLTLELGDSFPNREIAAGAILAQSPLPGQEVGPGTQVRVLTSTGRPGPTVPDIEAMPLSLATRALQTAGFEVHIEEQLAEGPAGRVVATDPVAGTRVQLPATVRVRIGGAASVIEMPMLIGLLEQPAREAVTALGLELAEVIHQENIYGQPGGVFAQEPAPGDSIAAGGAVRLYVTADAAAGVDEEQLDRGPVERLRRGRRGDDP
jgi:serine/threonine-protein kinase